jgi:hypothetical protein
VEQSITQDAPDQAANARASAAWAERQLSEAERESLRPYYPARSGPDLAYLARVFGFAIAFTAVWYFVLRRPFQLPPGALTAGAFGVLGLLIAILYNPARLRRAFRSRRAHVPRRVWVWTVMVTRWCGSDRQGETVHEIRCSLDGQTKAVEVTPEQFEWFPEGEAEAEVLPGGRRRIYRFRYGADTVQVYPVVRRMADGELEAAQAFAVEEPVQPAPGAAPGSLHRKRKRQHGGRKRGSMGLRRQDLVWLGVVLVLGTSLTLVALQGENRSVAPAPNAAGH